MNKVIIKVIYNFCRNEIKYVRPIKVTGEADGYYTVDEVWGKFMKQDAGNIILAINGLRVWKCLDLDDVKYKDNTEQFTIDICRANIVSDIKDYLNNLSSSITVGKIL